MAFATTLLEDDAIASNRRIIDGSGDGVSNIGPPVIPARDEAVARGITINGLPVLISGRRNNLPDLDRYYEECVIGGPGALVLPAGSKEQMAPTILRKLIIEISGLEHALRPVAIGYQPIDCMIGEKL